MPAWVLAGTPTSVTVVAPPHKMVREVRPVVAVPEVMGSWI